MTIPFLGRRRAITAGPPRVGFAPQIRFSTGWLPILKAADDSLLSRLGLRDTGANANIDLGRYLMLQECSLLRQSDQALAANIGGETVVVDIDEGQYVSFDEIGSKIWRALEAPMRCDALCSRMADDFDGDAGIIARDTVAFVEKLIQRKLVIAG